MKCNCGGREERGSGEVCETEGNEALNEAEERPRHDGKVEGGRRGDFQSF